jgi:hypothetical protein
MPGPRHEVGAVIGTEAGPVSFSPGPLCAVPWRPSVRWGAEGPVDNFEPKGVISVTL